MFSNFKPLMALLMGICIIAGCMGCASAATTVKELKPIVIRPNQPSEKPYLIEDHSACIETGSDPQCPYIRIADGKDMFYIYKFSPGKDNMAFLLINVASQFFISASDDNGATYTKISAMKECELVGTRVFIDLTQLVKKTGNVYLKFEDKYKEDGWGALTTEIRYYNAGKGSDSRLTIDNWMSDGQPYTSGATVASGKPVVFSSVFTAPQGWNGADLAVYFSAVDGIPASAVLNGAQLKLERTWDQGYWADVSKTIIPGTVNKIEITVNSTEGKAGLWTPVRVGLRYPACAVPEVKTSGDRSLRANRQYEPYTIDEMNYLAGNFMQTLYDDRYNLLAFAPSERMTVHYLHDTFRSLVALAEEERHTPAARVELVRKLYKGCKGGLLPGGEYLFAFKHDQRPIDIRPFPNSSDLVFVQKMDNWSYVCPVGITDEKSSDTSAAKFKDTPVKQTGNSFAFRRTWNLGDRKIPVNAKWYLGDAGKPSSLEFELDGKGPVRIKLSKLAESGQWFTPGSWGPEAVVLPDGKEMWVHKENIYFNKPSFNFLMLRGGNGNIDLQPTEMSFVKALAVIWNTTPDKITTSTIKGGRYGKLVNDVYLEYENDTPGKVKITLMPFAGYPASLKAPRAIVNNVIKTGTTGMRFYDVSWTTNSNGIGPDGLAAAAYILKKYNCPEAKEAEQLAVNSMRAFIKLDKEGTRTNELYYIISGCMYLHQLGYTEFDEWARIWADRMMSMRHEDGSWEWLNFQLRCMEGLLRSYELLGDTKYLDAVNTALKTIEYKDNNLYWKGKVDYYDDFGGATTYAIFGFLGMKDMAQKALDARFRYIDDRGFVACSDLNPYMLGLAANGLGMPAEPKQVLGLTDFLLYDYNGVRKQNMPTSYIVNPHHPLAKTANFKLDE